VWCTLANTKQAAWERHLFAVRCPPSAEAPGAVTAGSSRKSPSWSARHVPPWLWRAGDGITSAAFPLALCQGWYPPGTKVTDAERRQHPLAATSCVKHAVLLFHEHSAGFCHLIVSLRSSVSGRHSGTLPHTAKSQHELTGDMHT